MRTGQRGRRWRRHRRAALSGNALAGHLVVAACAVVGVQGAASVPPPPGCPCPGRTSSGPAPAARPVRRLRGRRLRAVHCGKPEGPTASASRRPVLLCMGPGGTGSVRRWEIIAALVVEDATDSPRLANASAASRGAGVGGPGPPPGGVGCIDRWPADRTRNHSGPPTLQLRPGCGPGRLAEHRAARRRCAGECRITAPHNSRTALKRGCHGGEPPFGGGRGLSAGGVPGLVFVGAGESLVFRSGGFEQAAP
jgi:hypothetical protein